MQVKITGTLWCFRNINKVCYNHNFCH